MNLLKTIIERLNQRIEVANIFDKQFNLCELNANGNEKAWVHYIGNGQAEVVTNFDAKNGTLFWAKRGKVTVAKTDAYKMSGCKQLYVTSFPLTAYAIVRKSHLPCDAEDAQDWLASRVYKLTSGTDPLFKQSIGVINYEVVPTGYANEIKSLTANYEWACVSVDMDVQVITTSEDGCYDTCATGDIPLPDLQPCTPCLTEVAVDGVTITGNGTTADPLVAIGGGGGTPLITKNEGTNVSTNTTTLNFTGAGVTASLTSPGVVEVNVPGGGGGGGVTSVSGTAPIASSGGTTPDISITQADGTTDGYLTSTDWNTFDGKFNVPTGLSTDYLDGLGTPTPFPAIPVGTVTSVNSGININVDNTNPAAPIINSLADRYKTSSTTSNSVSNGSKNFTVDLNLSYIPLQEILVVFNPANHMHGEVTSYDAATGALVVNIKTHTGSGTYTSWVLNLDGTPVDAITGSGTTNEIAYFTAARIIASLPVATYPSLTELSYVKGVTSAIQTQINGKQATITPAALTKVDDTNVTLTLGGTPATALLQGVSITAGWSGTLADSRISSAATWNAKQDALVSGTNIKTINSTSLLGSGNITIASLGVYKILTDGAASSGTANTFSQSVLVPGNSIVVNNVVEFKMRARKTGASGLYTIRLYANTTNNLSGSPILLATFTATSANAIGMQMIRTAAIKNATTNTEMALSTATNAADYGNTSFVSNSVDWTTDKYIIGAVQNVNAGDSSLISYISITIV